MMDEVNKLLDESSKRLHQISDLIMENLTDETAEPEISKLYDIAKEMDRIKHKAKVEQAAIHDCKVTLSQVNEPWNCVIQEMFDENLEHEKQKKSKIKEDFLKGLQKHVNKKNQGNEEMEVIEETHTVVDPWTKQPIQMPVKSSVCNHMYDKRSIKCIIKNRNQFKCPYVGCQHIVSKDDLVDMD